MKKRDIIIIITIFVITILFIAILAITGYVYIISKNSAEDEVEEKVNYELTKRQISLLKELGLPTDYEKLSLNQKSAIESIEDLLNYLEEKYGKTFNYVGYVPGGALEKEHLIAYPSDGLPDDEVTVYRTYVDKEFHYEDNYKVVLAKPLYESVMNEFISENVNNTNAKIFCKVILANENVTKENVLNNVSGSVYVFLDEAYCTKDEYNNLLDKCGQFLIENVKGRPCSIWILRTTNANLEIINKDNFENKLSEDNIFSLKNACTINSSGELKVYNGLE